LFDKELNRTYFPTFTITNPEQVILSRAAALAKRSFFYLLSCMSSGLEPEVGAVFQESPQSLKSFIALLCVNPAILVDLACSSIDGDCSILTDENGQVTWEDVLQDWQPVTHLVHCLRSKFGDKAVFFLNDGRVGAYESSCCD